MRGETETTDRGIENMHAVWAPGAVIVVLSVVFYAFMRLLERWYDR